MKTFFDAHGMLHTRQDPEPTSSMSAVFFTSTYLILCKATRTLPIQVVDFVEGLEYASDTNLNKSGLVNHYENIKMSLDIPIFKTLKGKTHFGIDCIAWAYNKRHVNSFFYLIAPLMILVDLKNISNCIDGENESQKVLALTTSIVFKRRMSLYFCSLAVGSWKRVFAIRFGNSMHPLHELISKYCEKK